VILAPQLPLYAMEDLILVQEQAIGGRIIHHQYSYNALTQQHVLEYPIQIIILKEIVLIIITGSCVQNVMRITHLILIMNVLNVPLNL
jgi:hypothetical protein